MIAHAMKYVARSRLVRAQLGTHPRTADLRHAEQLLVEAEVQLVAAYRRWRELMKEVSPDSPLATQYVEDTVWDLT